MNQGRNGNGSRAPVTAVAGQSARVEMDRALLHQILGSAQDAMADRERELLGDPDAVIKVEAPTAQERLELRMAGVKWAQCVLTAELVDLLTRRPGLSAAESAAMAGLLSGKG